MDAVFMAFSFGTFFGRESMNIYLIVILGSMFAALLVDVAATALNIRHLDPELPEEFKDQYDADEYARSQRYVRDGARLDILSGVLGTAGVTAFILLGGFQIADGFVRGFGFGPIATGLVFYALLFLATDLLSIPMSLYRTFVLEERYGFNKTTPGTYIADRLKLWLLTMALGGPLCGMVLWFFESAGPLAWLWAWGGTTALMIGLQYIAPSVILPLFNKFTPLPEGELRSAIENYAAKADFELTGIFTIDGSRRSAKSNAFFTGFGKKKRIALFDTLIANHSPSEIVAVLAHEVGHHKCGHIPRMMTLSIVKMGVVFFLMSLFLDNRALFDAFGMEYMSIYAGLVFFLLLYNPVATALGVAVQALSRRHEYQADAFAARTTGNPDQLINALKTLSVSNLSNLTPHPLYVTLHHSHPPVLERVAALRNME